MADINAKLNVKNETDYTRINLVTKSDIIDFNKTGTDLNSTNAQGAIVEINIKTNDLKIITDDLKKDIIELGKSVADGKALIASAITKKGVPTVGSDSFVTIADNVSKIKTTAELISLPQSYTFPYDGKVYYQWGADLVQHDNSSSGYAEIAVKINGSNVDYQRDDIKAWDGSSLLVSRILSVKKGQTISTYFYCNVPNEQMGWKNFWSSAYAFSNI